ncbi:MULTISPECIES: FUSC family protein [Burkholderia cepacia complex]|uniref:Membrane protein-like protein n=3 Tax=Burkholderia cepacia complex TaxID=87882 RepID=A4JSB7_BURVG|nr:MULTISPECIES: FUSC family protein [Burkholderia cepacia complex]ABO59170.1 membrane protein-like protein [Burkholderia vietnamiensis G4]AOJ76746.1 fusaric acid resistance protein [Burkholderia ubonensis]AOK13838.1 fusaric acid resistance protein [Burkholderia vietnamiensis]MBR8214794.1 FUSC family protein [Burkholderia vietnamiensis]MCA8015303.1 FUSC family protein [Burkholderia vietnamiensis]
MGLVSTARDRLRRFVNLGGHYLPLAEALRGGLICVVPAVAAARLHMPMLCWSAIAAFWTCLADESERPAAGRLATGLSFGMLGGLASASAIATHALPPLSIVIVGAVAYLGASARKWGGAAGTRGILTATACAVSACFPVHGGASAVQYALFYFGGSVWATLAGIVLWQTDGSARARMATMAFLHAMANFVERLARAANGDSASLERGRAALRARLDAMIAVSMHPRGGLPPLSAKWRADAERAMALLAGLESHIAAAGVGERREAAALLAPVLAQLARLVEACPRAVGRDGAAADAAQSLANDLAELRATLAGRVAEFRVAHRDDAGLTWLRACETLIARYAAVLLHPAVESPSTATVPAALTAPAPGKPARGAGRLAALRREIVAPNPFHRYASRLAVAAMIAVALARISGVQQGYWLALTTMFIMQPTLSQTVKLSGLRIGGTLLGAVLASAVSLLVHDPLLLALAVLPLATGTLATRSVSYVSYILFLTSHFILVAHLGTPIGPSWMLAALRVGNSFAGVLVGVLISLLAWPDREHHRIGEVADLAMAATATYLRAVGDDAPAPARARRESLTVLRRQACVAIDRLDATIAATRFESIASDPRTASATVAMQQMKALVGALAPVEYLDDTLDALDRATIAAAARDAARLIADAAPAPAPAHATRPESPRDGDRASGHAREIQREVAERAWIVHALRSRISAVQRAPLRRAEAASGKPSSASRQRV